MTASSSSFSSPHNVRSYDTAVDATAAAAAAAEGAQEGSVLGNGNDNDKKSDSSALPLRRVLNLDTSLLDTSIESASSVVEAEGEEAKTCNGDERNEEKDLSCTFYDMERIRNHIFDAYATVGQLSALFRTVVPKDVPPSLNSQNPSISPIFQQHPELQALMKELLNHLFELCHDTLRLDWTEAVLKKLHLNRAKYPRELCEGKAGKYTKYSQQTGITKDAASQSTVNWNVTSERNNLFTLAQATLRGTENDETNNTDNNNDCRDTAVMRFVVQEFTGRIREFAEERQWSQYHLPRNLLLALSGELGELAELVQWNADPQGDQFVLSQHNLDQLGQEIADVSIYLMRLADVTGLSIV